MTKEAMRIWIAEVEKVASEARQRIVALEVKFARGGEAPGDSTKLFFMKQQLASMEADLRRIRISLG